MKFNKFAFIVAETDTPVKEKKKKKNKGEKDLGNIQKSSDFTVESSTIVAKLDSSKWPLLLKVVNSTFLILPIMYFLNYSILTV